MKVHSINTVNQTLHQRKSNFKPNRFSQSTKLNSPIKYQPSFKGVEGKFVGGCIGAGVAAIGFLDIVATGGLGTMILMALTQTGGFVAGSAVGGAITKPDDDDD